jgi:hypothetical protein
MPYTPLFELRGCIGGGSVRCSIRIPVYPFDRPSAMKRKTAIGGDGRNPAHPWRFWRISSAPDYRELRKPGIPRLIEASMRRGSVRFQSRHRRAAIEPCRHNRAFLFSTGGGNQRRSRDWQTGPPGTPRMNCSFEDDRRTPAGDQGIFPGRTSGSLSTLFVSFPCNGCPT